MYIIASDIHIMEGEREEYRWETFDILEQVSEGQTVEAFLLFGDLTEFKDRHSATLTNRMVKCITRLAAIAPVKILLGNHDYAVHPTNAFFKFLGSYPNIEWIDTITEDTIYGEPVLWLPNSRNPEEDWSSLDFSMYSYVFGHQATIGAKLTEGYSLGAGIDPSLFDSVGKNALFGDIHVPQNLGKKLISIGAPARFKFGDDYTPRILILDENGIDQIETELLVKHKIKVGPTTPIAAQLEEFNLLPDDQVKVICMLETSDYSLFARMKKDATDYIRSIGATLHSIEPSLAIQPSLSNSGATPAQTTTIGALEDYSKKENLHKDILNKGKHIVKCASGYTA